MQLATALTMVSAFGDVLLRLKPRFFQRSSQITSSISRLYLWICLKGFDRMIILIGIGRGVRAMTIGVPILVGV